MIINLESGIYNLAADVYHADPCPKPSLSSSIAHILLEQSAQHAWLAHPRLNPAYRRDVDSRFDLGSAAHMMLLERREDAIVVVDAPDWRTKAAKEARDQAQAQGRYAVLARQYADVQEMCAAARAYLHRTELGNILDAGDAERSVIWQEGETWCRIRPDLMSQDRRVMLDYKTTDSAAPDAFARVLGRLSYDMQAEFYLRGLQAITGREDTVFVFLVQEINKPYACSLISLSNAYREVGQLKVARALGIWAQCTSTNDWPGYSREILYCEPKPWDLVAAAQLESAAPDEGDISNEGAP